jgi:AI2M/AI1M-like, HNH endonuclease
VLQASVPREGKPPLVATWGGIPLKRNMKATLEEKTPRLWNNRTELVLRLLADFCELCGSEAEVEVHHVQAMRKLHDYPGRPKPARVKRMIALRRKTLVLCKRCHVAIEHGLPTTWALITLKVESN